MRSNPEATAQYKDLFYKEAASMKAVTDWISDQASVAKDWAVNAMKSRPSSKTIPELMDIVGSGFHGAPAVADPTQAARLAKKIHTAIGTRNYSDFSDSFKDLVSKGVAPEVAIGLASDMVKEPVVSKGIMRDLLDNKGKILTTAGITAGAAVPFAISRDASGYTRGYNEATERQKADTNSTRAAIAAGSALAGYALPIVTKGLFDSAGFGDSFDEDYIRSLQRGE